MRGSRVSHTALHKPPLFMDKKHTLIESCLSGPAPGALTRRGVAHVGQNLDVKSATVTNPSVKPIAIAGSSLRRIR